MFQIKLPVRAYKKLIYLAAVSSFFCFLALHLTISYQKDRIPYEFSTAAAAASSIPLLEANGISSPSLIDRFHQSGTASNAGGDHGNLIDLGEVFRGILQKSSIDSSASNKADSSSSLSSDAKESLSDERIRQNYSNQITIIKNNHRSNAIEENNHFELVKTQSENQSQNKSDSDSYPQRKQLQKSLKIDPKESTINIEAHNERNQSLINLNEPIGTNNQSEENIISQNSNNNHTFATDDQDIHHYLDLEVQIDNVPVLNENQIFEEIEHTNNNNLALSYWLKARKYPKPKPSPQTNNSTNANNNSSGSNGKTCRAEFPNLYEIEFNNIYWQTFSGINGSSFYLYGAYYDNRWRGGVLPMIRILAMIDRISPPPTLCQIWFDRISVPIISPATYIYGWYNKWGNYKDGFLQPYIITCKIPRIKGLPKDFYPTSVSLVENRCSKASNNLRIINNRPEQKQEFAVCVKGLDFLHEDLSVRLVEWIELLRLLGAQKIFLYELEIHPNITKVLNYYQETGLVELTKITLPGHQPNLPGFRHLYLKNKLTNKRQNELIPYNDCLYRNLYSYNYVVLLDIDEVIMPIKHQNWSELMREVQRLSLLERNYTRASYNVRNVYFLDDLNHNEEQMRHEAHEAGVPRYLHMLQHVYRSQNYTNPGQYVKCFHNTERAVSLHNHFPLNCFGSCTTFSIPIQLAHLQHYRKDCVGPLKKSCKEFRTYTTRDTTIFRYKDDLIHRTTLTLKRLGFFHHRRSSRALSSTYEEDGDRRRNR